MKVCKQRISEVIGKKSGKLTNKYYVSTWINDIEDSWKCTSFSSWSADLPTGETKYMQKENNHNK